MKRRDFLRSLGGAVAAAMLPFVRPLDQPKWRSNISGIRAALANCSRYVEPTHEGSPGHGYNYLDLEELRKLLYALKRDRPHGDEITIITDAAGRKAIERLAGVT